ncbi:MAG TPA: hypothetical protein VF548_07520 [Allosphingosinicella sp.]|jgi:hypothetical protein
MGIRRLSAGALACIAVFGFHGWSLAQSKSEPSDVAPVVKARACATEKSLLEALLQRRAEAGITEDARTLEALDNRIAQVRNRVESECVPLPPAN